MGQLSLLSQQNSLTSDSANIRRLDLKVGYACSNDCLFCVVADKRVKGEKTTAQIKKELRDSYREGKREVVLTGGEVTIRPDIFEIVEYARSIGYENVPLQTNGRRFADREFCKRMARAGMTTLMASLHGPDASIHDGLTCRPGSWRQTVLGIHHMIELGVKTVTNTVVTKQNYTHLPDMARLLVKLGVLQFQFAFVHIQGHALTYYKKIVPRISKAAIYMMKGLEIGLQSGRRVMTEAVPLCLLPGYEKYAAEFLIPPSQCKEIGNVVENFDVVRKFVAKIKLPGCRRCRWCAQCEGPWIEYPKLFGTKEFKPVTA